MGKTILINQDSLLALKENMVGTSSVSHNTVCVNEARPEVDEYELGQETDNPLVGGNYCHVEENTIISESKNSNRAHRQTRQIIAQTLGGNENDPSVVKAEREFEARMFGEGKRTDWMIVLEPFAYEWYLQTSDINIVQRYLDYIYLKGTESNPPSAYIANIKKFNDFNGLKQFIDQQKKADDEASMKAQENMEVNLNQNYEVRGPLNFEEAYEIGRHSCPNGEICYTQDEDTWESETYGQYGLNKCYVLLRNDWQNVEPKHDGSEVNNGLPAPLNEFNGYDSYGLSMIFVWIGRFGNLIVSNTRWNHMANYAPGHGVDQALKEVDIARLMGAPFEQVFGVKKIDINAYIKESFENPNMNIYDIFDDVYNNINGIQVVTIGNKYNYVVYENRSLYGYDYQYKYLLWDKPYEEWFDTAGDFNLDSGLGVVEFNGKAFFIDRNAELYELYETTKKMLADGKTNMFDNVRGEGAICRVSYFYGKFNYINTNTKELLWDKPYEEWFDGARVPKIHDRYVLVCLGDKYYFFNVEDKNICDITETVKKRLKVENPVYIFDSFDNYTVEKIRTVCLGFKSNFVNSDTDELLWDKPYDDWFDYIQASFNGNEMASVEYKGKICKLDKTGKLYDMLGELVEESNTLTENYDMEVSSSEIDLSSFKKKKELAPIWQDEDTLDSRVRLRLLDIADDFWEFVNLTWVKPSGIILTGSICNFNWSQFSDIDLHLIVDFDEIDEKTEFVQDYLDAKKNEWNNEHNELRLMGFPVELYVQNVGEMPESGGIYDLEDNSWLKRPNSSDIKSIGLDKFSIKDKAAEIMTIIDDMYDTLNDTTDSHEIEQIGDDAHYLWKKVKNMRKKSLEKNGESGAGNIVYKILRRMKYLDKLWKLSTITYDRTNSIQEELSKYKDVIALLKEEVVADGSSEGNPYKKRWKAERDALKNFIANYGKLMQSKEDDKGGKLYKVYFDKTMSDLIGYNYCICVQWDEQQLKPKSTVYIRALDKFTPFIRRNLQYDDRGFDNQMGTYDDVRYNPSYNVTESVNELSLYHASYSNFDKFNHKKYLSSGAGSQTFGWGTYLTDSYPIAKDYAEKFILLKFNEFIVKAEPEKYIENNGSYDEELIKEAAKTYKQIVRFDVCMRPEGRWGKNSFDSLLKADEKASENYDNALKEYEQTIQMAKSWAEDVLKKEFDTESFKANYPKNNILKFSREEYINNINRQNTTYQLVKEIINNIWDDADKHVRKESYIYEVETPDDNGLNYIDLNNEVPNEIIESITSTLSKISRRYGGEWKTMSKWCEFLSYYNNAPKGEYIYDELGKLIGVETSIGNYDKAISLFLLQCGIDGFKYKAGTIYGLPDGADENSTNYVIFDANKVRIVSKNLFTDTF